jgi:hypothetical protein
MDSVWIVYEECMKQAEKKQIIPDHSQYYCEFCFKCITLKIIRKQWTISQAQVKKSDGEIRVYSVDYRMVALLSCEFVFLWISWSTVCYVEENGVKKEKILGFQGAF